MQRIAEIVRAWESAGEVYRREDSQRAVDDISELVQSYRREVETIGNGLARKFPTWLHGYRWWRQVVIRLWCPGMASRGQDLPVYQIRLDREKRTSLNLRASAAHVPVLVVSRVYSTT